MPGFPPHTSRLQPLDAGFYGSFQKAYGQASDDFRNSRQRSFGTEKKEDQEDKELKKQTRLIKKTNKKKGEKTKPRWELNFSSTSDDNSSHSIPCIDTEQDMDLEDFETNKFCILWEEEGKDELWHQCLKCLNWAQDECSGWNRRQAKQRSYKRDLCI